MGIGDFLSQESLIGSCLVIEAPYPVCSLSSGLDACCRQTKGISAFVEMHYGRRPKQTNVGEKMKNKTKTQETIEKNKKLKTISIV